MPTWLHQGALTAALACCLLAAPAQAQQDAAVIKRATELRQGPAESSASLGALAGTAAAGSNTATSGLRSLGGLFGGGSSTTATATVGIRGLSAEDIANAQPNPAAVQQAEKLRVSAD